METLEALFPTLMEILFSCDLLLYLAMIAEGVFSIFLWKKSGKTKTTEQIVDHDIDALIDYHEKVASELKKKKNNLK